MPLALLFIIVGLPLLEIVLLIRLGQWIGFWATLLVVMAAAFTGLAIVNHQGMRAFNATTAALAKGEPPLAAMTDGVMLMIAGTLLIMPGLLTDAIALALLVPPVRRWVASAWLARMLRSGNIHVATGGASRPDRRSDRRGGTGNPPAADGPLIEGEFERLDEKTVDPAKPRRPREP